MATTKLGVVQLAADQAQKHVTLNEALSQLDQLVQQTVKNRTTTAPPAGPSEGDAYIIAVTATGDWTGRENDIAAYVLGAWVYFTPRTGWIAWDEGAAVHLRWNGTTWENAFPVSGGTFGWHDYQDTGGTISLTLADTWYDVTNDGAGALSDDTFAISGHGDIWDTATNTLDFSSLSVGDVVRFRTDWTFTTGGSNHMVESRLVFGPAYAYSLPFDQFVAKNAAAWQRLRYFSFTIKSADVLNNPAKFQVRSDATGDTVAIEGFQIETHRP